jgi:heme/copper-type cytochrome/quinol oxidase subunit 2
MSYTIGLYFLNRLDTFRTILTIMIIIGIVGLVLYYFFNFMSTELERAKMAEYSSNNKWTRRTLITITVIGIAGLTFIPTTKQMIFIIAGGKTLDYVSKDQSLRKIPGQVTEITTEWLDKKLKEIQADVKQEAGIE